MEHRTELQEVLLAGLPEQERRETVESMQRATTTKLDHLRSLQDREEVSADYLEMLE